MNVGTLHALRIILVFPLDEVWTTAGFMFQLKPVFTVFAEDAGVSLNAAFKNDFLQPPLKMLLILWHSTVFRLNSE